MILRQVSGEGRRDNGTAGTQTEKRNADGRGNYRQGRGSLDSRESSEHRVSFSLSEQKKTLATLLLASRAALISRWLRERDSPLDSLSERSAAVPEVSAAICVSSVPGVDPL